MFTIEDYMVKDLHLSGTSLLVFAFLTTKGVFEDSMNTLKEEVGAKSVNTIKSALGDLEKKDLITITKQGVNTPSTIQVTYSSTKTPQEMEKVNPRERLFRRRGIE